MLSLYHFSRAPNESICRDFSTCQTSVKLTEGQAAAGHNRRGQTKSCQVTAGMSKSVMTDCVIMCKARRYIECENQPQPTNPATNISSTRTASFAVDFGGYLDRVYDAYIQEAE